jgi:serine/threonine protein kinase
LNHPNLLRLLHVGRDDAAGFYWYIMELADDEFSGQMIVPERYSPKDLGKELTQRGALPVRECVELMLPLVSALEYVHSKDLVHRDIKPANVIFVAGIPKLADIGLVTAIRGPGSRQTQVFTPGYMVAELLGTPAGDFYGLGKILYEACTGQDRQQFPELPQAAVEGPHATELFLLNPIILKACETTPQRNYQSAADLRADLERLHRKLIHPRRT